MLWTKLCDSEKTILHVQLLYSSQPSLLFCISISGHETKSMLINCGSWTKRSKLERDINTEILSSLEILLVLCIIGSTGQLLLVMVTSNWLWVWVYYQVPEYGHSQGLSHSSQEWGTGAIHQIMIVLQVSLKSLTRYFGTTNKCPDYVSVLIFVFILLGFTVTSF